MSTAESDRLERDASANDASIVVEVRDDGNEGFAKGLDQDARKHCKRRPV